MDLLHVLRSRLGWTLVMAAASPLLGGCSSTCPAGRVPAESGVCVTQNVADFVACVRGASGAELSQDKARQISATVMQVGGGLQWQDRVQAAYAGPNEQNQRLVIDRCIQMTGEPAKTLTLTVFEGKWVSFLGDGERKELMIRRDGEFWQQLTGSSMSCKLHGRMWVDQGKYLRRQILDASCADALVGHTASFEVVNAADDLFEIKSEEGSEVFRRAAH